MRAGNHRNSQHQSSTATWFRFPRTPATCLSLRFQSPATGRMLFAGNGCSGDRNSGIITQCDSRSVRFVVTLAGPRKFFWNNGVLLCVVLSCLLVLFCGCLLAAWLLEIYTPRRIIDRPQAIRRSSMARIFPDGTAWDILTPGNSRR